MRERIHSQLGSLPHSNFLVYLMGPYRAYDVESVLHFTDVPPETVDFSILTGSPYDLSADEATLDLLLDIRDRLRTNVGVNAFLAIDVDIPLSELDAASQSIAFAKASNAIAFIVPAIGSNLGVGIEVGSVMEALSSNETSELEDRVIFAHEDTINSTMISSLSIRWDVRVYRYSDLDDLEKQLRLFSRDVMRKERTGQLSPK